MNRTMRIAGSLLLIVAVLEFGLLGVNAAGSGRGQDRQDGPGARPTSTPAPALGGAPASIQITPDPLAIACDPSHSVTLTARLTDADGRPVSDGTPVQFLSYGVAPAVPSVALTRNGTASTELRPYGTAPFDATINVDVRAGGLEVEVRIPCRGACPISPPATSPPCAAPTPGPCDAISPPAVSPPCAPPPPAPCDSMSPPAVSPPCAAPTPVATDGTGPTLSISADGLAVTLVASGTGFDPYRAFNYSLRYDPAALAFAAAAFHFPAERYCVEDRWTFPGHIMAACVTLGPVSTTAVGPLATLAFTAKGTAPGCTVVHLVSLGPPDGGDTSTGTFTVNGANVPRPQSNPYGAGTLWLPLNGGSCAGAPPTITPTPTPTPTARLDTIIVFPTGTATPVPDAASTPAP